MSSFTVITGREKEKFSKHINRMESAAGPDFLVYDEALVKYWDRLNDVFPDTQFYLMDDANGATAGVGRCIPLAFTGSWADLPDEGLSAAHRPSAPVVEEPLSFDRD